LSVKKHKTGGALFSNDAIAGKEETKQMKASST
jgi:hypothetical protein